MNNKTNRKKDVIINLVSSTYYFFVLWLMTMLTPKLGNASDAGIYTIVLSVANICTAVATFGIDIYIASDTKNRFTDQHYFYFGIITILISILISIIISLCFGYQHSNLFWAVFIYYIFKCAENFSTITNGNMLRAGKLYIANYSLVIRSSFVLLIYLLTLYLTKNILLAYGCIAIFVYLYLFFVTIPILRKFTDISIKLDKKILKSSVSLFYFALSGFIYTISLVIIGNIPRMILGQCFSKEIVGYYGTMSAISTIILAFANAIFLPFMPSIADNYHKKNYKNLFKIIGIFMVGIIGATLLAFMLSLFLSEWVLKLLYPAEEIEKAIKYAYCFKWIILSSGIQALAVLGCTILITFRKMLFLAVFSIISLVAMFPMSYSLIPNKGIDGVNITLISCFLFLTISTMSYIIFLLIRNKKNPGL